MQPTMMNLKVQCFKYMEDQVAKKPDGEIPDESEMFDIAEQFLTDTFNVQEISQIIAANWDEISKLAIELNSDMMIGFWIAGNRIGIGRDIDKVRGMFGLIEMLIANALGNFINEQIESAATFGHLILDEDPDGTVQSVEMWHWTEIADRAAKEFIDAGKHLILFNPDTPHQVWTTETIPINYEDIEEDYTMEEAAYSVISGWHDFRNTQSVPGAMDGSFIDRMPHLVHRLIHIVADFEDIAEERIYGISQMMEQAISKSLVVETRNRVYDLLSESYAMNKTFKAMVKNDDGNWDEETVIGKYIYTRKEK